MLRLNCWRFALSIFDQKSLQWRFNHRIENMKTTSMSMETVSTGVLDKNKEHFLRTKDKADKAIWCIKTYIIAYVVIQKMQPNCCLKVDFQKWTNIEIMNGPTVFKFLFLNWQVMRLRQLQYFMSQIVIFHIPGNVVLWHFILFCRCRQYQYKPLDMAWEFFGPYAPGALNMAVHGSAQVYLRTTFYKHGLALIPAWISNHMPCEVHDNIT